MGLEGHSKGRGEGEDGQPCVMKEGEGLCAAEGSPGTGSGSWNLNVEWEFGLDLGVEVQQRGGQGQACTVTSGRGTVQQIGKDCKKGSAGEGRGGMQQKRDGGGEAKGGQRGSCSRTRAGVGREGGGGLCRKIREGH